MNGLFSLEGLIIGLVISSVIVFWVSHFSAKVGAILTTFISLMAFGFMTYFGYVDHQSLLLDSNLIEFGAIGFMFEYSDFAVFFTVILTFIYAMASFYNPFFIETIKYKKAYNAFWVLSIAGVVGVFFAQHMLGFFLLFELIVWSTMFLVQMGKKKEAAISYFGFSMAGSVSLLFAIFYMVSTNPNATNVWDLSEQLSALSGSGALIVFVLLLVAGFSKLGAFPFNIWLPKAHGSAPHPFSPVLSGGLVKLGAFVSILALVKISPFTPDLMVMELPWAQWVVALLGSLSIIFGTLMAIRSDDAKVLLAYSSMSNGGYILVAFALADTHAIAGGLYHVLVHAIASAAAFLAIAAVARQTHTTKISELGGIIHKMPLTYMVYLIAIISMAGIPPMGGFISKWLIYQTALNKGMILVTMAVTFGSIGSFLYVFRPLAALFLGQELPEYKHLKEAPFFMAVPMVILSILNLLTGTITTFFLNYVNPVLLDLGFTSDELLVIPNNTIEGWTEATKLNPLLMGGIFAFGVFVAFVLFIVLKKSKKVGLMDTYTAGNFIYTEQLLHYSTDFYAPIERLYERYIHITESVYKSISQKVKEFGRLMKYIFFNRLLEVFTLGVIIIMIVILLSEVVS
jgi:formate hydrogenlyase subunit 3/multisubunit Na+/H+ antiporter MnhD subunit